MQLDALAFGAHPDDVELACAGTLIKLFSNGYKTGAMALTDGELGTRGTREIRCQEFGNSAQVMGLARHGTLGLPDGHIELNRCLTLNAFRKNSCRGSRPIHDGNGNRSAGSHGVQALFSGQLDLMETRHI